MANAPDFVDFVATIPMNGIRRLCGTVAQQTFLENYYTTVWAPTRSQKYQIYPDYVDSLIVISSTDSNIVPPAGYIKVPYNLNRGTAGKFIYLCYH